MRDVETKVELGALDPEAHAPGYWDRSHARVMQAVRATVPGWAERPVTLGDALLSWSRLAVPIAATAAALATFVLLRPAANDDLAGVAGLEEVLFQPGDGTPPLPSFLLEEEFVERDMILLAMEEF
jgi:hypothetical protein